MDGPRGRVGVWMFCGWVRMWIPVKKKKQKEREKKKVHTAGGGRERADGCVEAVSCRRADGCADVWARRCGWL